MYPTTYFATNYFPASYFTTTGPGPVVVEPPVATYRDTAALEAILAALKATGGFSSVILALPGEAEALPGDGYPAAIITPVEWDEVDDAAVQSAIRHVTYTLTLRVRGEAGVARLSRLDRLSALAHNALEGSDLGGGCLPAASRLSRGRFDPRARPPEASVVLTGTFAYPIPAIGTRDVAP